jgi:hypothetical protein
MEALLPKESADARKEREYRLMESELHRQFRPSSSSEVVGPQCVHCGQPFDPHASTGGEYGICQSCIDDR